MILHGDQDETIPVDEAYSAHGLNPDRSELAIIPDADHMFSNKAHRKHISRKIVKWFGHQF